MKAIAYYFSATGNTARAMAAIKESLEAEGGSLELRELKAGAPRPSDLGGFDLLILSFPVLGFGAPRFVRAFAKGLRAPLGGMRAAVLAVDGGGGGKSPDRIARILRRRGFRTNQCARASYPDNWTQIMPCSVPEAELGVVTDKGDAKARAFGQAFIHGERLDNSGPSLGVFEAPVNLMFRTMGRRFLGKLFVADRDCDACGLCARLCPANTIVIGKSAKAKPYWRMNCENCNRCINICPKQAINTSWGRIVVLVAALVALLWAAYGPGLAALGSLLAPLAFDGALKTAALVLAGIVAFFAAHYVVVGPVDSLIVRPLQAIPFLRPFFAWNFSKSFRRYRAVPYGKK
jgi:ferredoxin